MQRRIISRCTAPGAFIRNACNDQLVPILIKQLEGYQDGMEDDLLPYFKKKHTVGINGKKRISSRRMFHANFTRMISRSPRFIELREKKKPGRSIY